MPAASQFELRRKLLQLEALYDVGRALNTLRPEDELLEELMHRAVAVLDATTGFVFSLDDKLNIQTHFTFGLEVTAPELMLIEPPIKQVLASREAMMVTVSRFLGNPGSDLLIAPMISGDAVLGVIGVGGKEVRGATKAGAFIEDDLRFLESIGSIGGAAIENTRSFHKLDLVRETLADENRALKQRMLRDYSDRLMVGDSAKMQRVIDLVARVADSQASVIIRGESGTGKEMVARLIHGNSPRKDGPFVAINCAALPETLLESELFGIERGVATGVEARPGRFELAKGGTIFLDEIGDIPVTLQAKLLRVLQEREIEKLGGRRRIPVDVRILSATHRNLEEMIEKAEFRQDLYYRLKVVEITLPPLRERRDDIPKLVRFFLDKYGKTGRVARRPHHPGGAPEADALPVPRQRARAGEPHRRRAGPDDRSRHRSGRPADARGGGRERTGGRALWRHADTGRAGGALHRPRAGIHEGQYVESGQDSGRGSQDALSQAGRVGTNSHSLWTIGTFISNSLKNNGLRRYERESLR